MELQKEFLDEAEAKILEIRSRLDGSGNTPPEESLKRMADLAHQLKGAGGSYGYAEISSHAAKLEDAIEAIDEGGGRAFESLEPLVNALSQEIGNRKELDTDDRDLKRNAGSGLPVLCLTQSV